MIEARRPGLARTRPATDRKRDPLTATFLDVHASERLGDPHEAAQRVCAEYAAGLQARRRFNRRLRIRGIVVIALATAVVWTWPWVVNSIW